MVEPRDRRIPIMFSEEELQDIDDWRLGNGIATRADAVRRLCKIALFMDDNFERLVDYIGEGVEDFAEASKETAILHRQILLPRLRDQQYSAEQVMDIVRMADQYLQNVVETMISTHRVSVNLFNAVAAIVNARTLKRGIRALKEYIAESHDAMDIVNQIHDEREMAFFFDLTYMIWTEEERAAHRSLSKEEQDEHWERTYAALKVEFDENPRAFAVKYGLQPFWKRRKWLDLLREKYPEDADLWAAPATNRGDLS